MRVWVVAAAVAVALAAGGLVGCGLMRPPSFHEPASVAALTRALDDVVPEALRRHGVPGAAVAVARSGRVAWARGYGVAHAARRTAVTADTVFQVASVSKPVAAMGALRLVEERRLGLDRPLTAWRFAPSDHDPRGVTLRRLLSHTAGVSVPGYPGHEPGRPLPSTAASLAGDSAGAGAVRLQSDAGAGYSYSGGGYTVAQLAVERAAGEPFAAWMRRAVLRPLGMRSSSFDQASANGALIAHGHDRTRLPMPVFRYAEQAAAGLYATAPDIARFAAALMPGPHGEPPGRGVVSAATIRTMTTPAPATRGRYGLGFALRTLADDVRMVSHGGANRGWRALLAAFPQRGWGIAVLTNGDNGEAVVDAVMDQLVAEPRRPGTRHPSRRFGLRSSSPADGPGVSATSATPNGAACSGPTASGDYRRCLEAVAAPSTRCTSGGRLVSMIRLLRLALQVVLFFLLLSLVVAVASVHTGTVEKVALIAAGAVLVWLASRVQRIGAPVRQA